MAGCGEADHIGAVSGQSFWSEAEGGGRGVVVLYWHSAVAGTAVLVVRRWTGRHTCAVQTVHSLVLYSAQVSQAVDRAAHMR